MSGSESLVAVTDKDTDSEASVVFSNVSRCPSSTCPVVLAPF